MVTALTSLPIASAAVVHSPMVIVMVMPMLMLMQMLIIKSTY